MNSNPKIPLLKGVHRVEMETLCGSNRCLVSEIEFTEWVPDGHLRPSKFVGLGKGTRSPAGGVERLKGRTDCPLQPNYHRYKKLTLIGPKPSALRFIST
jgi:hypothetical protein